MKEKILQIILGALILFVLGSLLYVAIKHPREYPGYEIPTYYSPYPIA